MISLHMIPVGVYRDITFPFISRAGSFSWMAEYSNGPFLKSYFHMSINFDAADLETQLGSSEKKVK